MPFRGRFAVALTVLLSAGCGGPTGPAPEKVAPVSGTLTYQGKPLKYYGVTFLPTDGRRPGFGTTDPFGKFTLSTNSEGDGAPLGTSKIAVAFAGPPQHEDASLTGAPIDNPALLPKPKTQVPTKYGNPETSGLTVDVPPEGLQDYKLDLK
jgi:hypothetical protein